MTMTAQWLLSRPTWSRIVASQSEGAFSGAVITEVAASIPQTEPELELNKVIPTQEKNMSDQIEDTSRRSSRKHSR
jgi:hypothetical protein